jgi:Fe2+ or Zn2+ uptake regulation protein
VSADPAAVLRATGLRVTQPRRAVLACLLRAGRHMTAEEVHGEVQRSLPGLPLQTVYAVLGDLVRVGALREVVLGRGPASFDPNTSRHHHLACRTCGRLVDVPCERVEEDQPCLRPPRPEAGWAVETAEVTFVGVCPDCRATGRGQAVARGRGGRAGEGRSRGGR